MSDGFPSRLSSDLLELAGLSRHPKSAAGDFAATHAQAHRSGSMNDVTTAQHVAIDIGSAAEHYSPRLRRFVSRRVGNPADVDDIVQDTFLEAFRCASSFRGESRPETWLCAIAMNLIRSFYRSRGRHSEHEHELEPDHDESSLSLEPGQRRGLPDIGHNPESWYEAREILRLIDARMYTLSSILAEPLDLLINEQMAYHEIAERLSIPIGTVRSRISRARASLVRDPSGSKAWDGTEHGIDPKS